MGSPQIWQPDLDTLKQLVGYLEDGLIAHKPDAQKAATLMLTQARRSPNIANHLTYILANGPVLQQLGISPESLILLRSSAALNLKNSIKESYVCINESSGSYIKVSLLSCLQDAAPQIRNFTGTVITEIVQQGGILEWPELLPELLSVAANDSTRISPAMQDGAMSALAKVCDDAKQDLQREHLGQCPLQYLIPRLIEITSSPIAKVRALALASINSFIPQQPLALVTALEMILVRLLELAYDPSDDVRRNVCRAFVLIVDVRPDQIHLHLEGLVDYMTLQQKNTKDAELALEAAEFWLAVGESDTMCTELGPHLSKIVPVLLDSMVYDEETIMCLQGDVDDAECEDRIEDIKPRFAISTTAKRMTPHNALSPQIDTEFESISNTTNAEGDSVDDGELGPEEDDDDNEGAAEDSWNLRKCSAAALDVLATSYHDSLFSVALPYLKNNLGHEDWPHREAAVLALGAVAEGCLTSIIPNLPDLIPYLLSLLNDNEPSVRIITCWTLGRYSGWASHLEDEGEQHRIFEPMMDGILQRMLDRDKRVQESAASAFANLEERAGTKLTPYCIPILQTFVQCFHRYKNRNMFILYDCVQTLAEQVGAVLRKPDITNLLMPIIIDRWSKTIDQSTEMFPLLECLSYIASALGDAFAPFAVPIFQRCIRIIHEHLEQSLLSSKAELADRSNKDFLVTSLDLLSAVVQALHPTKSGELVTWTQPNFFDLLILCMQDSNNDVRQSSYALLGDCAVNVFSTLQPHLPLLIPVLLGQLDVDKIQGCDSDDAGFSVINNACWSCGEIAMKYKQDMAPFVARVYPGLEVIISSPGIPISIKENAVITLGRLGVYCSQILAPHLAGFAMLFLNVIESVENTEEKSHAFLGFNRIIAENPQAMESCLLAYFLASARFVHLQPVTIGQEEAVKNSFYNNLAGFRSLIPNFDGFLRQMSHAERQLLISSYGL